MRIFLVDVTDLSIILCLDPFSKRLIIVFDSYSPCLKGKNRPYTVASYSTKKNSDVWWMEWMLYCNSTSPHFVSQIANEKKMRRG